ncbi:unnamed protein product [Orchesella dallaii]|uniref:Odorant receptor n=1 Tax=Orchesella dallaii TaxID=48710 RepID=A0ABP1S7Z4_9HEXA
MLRKQSDLFTTFYTLPFMPHSVPITWNPDTHQASFDEQSIKKTNFLYYLHTSALILMLIQLMLDTETSNFTKLPTFFSVICLIMQNLYLHIGRIHNHDIVLYINGLFQLMERQERIEIKSHRRVIEPKMNILEILNRLFAYALKITVTLTPLVFVYGLHWSDSNKSSLVGSVMLKYGKINMETEDTLKTSVKMILKVFLFLFNHYLWAAGLYALAVFMNWFHNLGTFILRCSLKKYLHNCLHNGKVYPTAQETLVYREIQVLSILNNIINQTVIFVLTTGVIFLLALCLTATIRLEWHMEHMLAVAFFGIISIDCFLFLLVCVGGMVGPYVESRKALETLKRQHPSSGFARRGSRYSFRWLQRYVKSCFLIKVKMGKDNFLEELTPLNCVNLAISVTVNILLLTVSHKEP